MKQILSMIAVVALLQGCDALKPDKTALEATNAAPSAGMRCDLCHGNPPNTGFHRYHIDTLGMKGSSVAGIPVISCITCHSATIAHASGRLAMDSAFVDSNNVSYHTRGWPWNDFERTADRQFYGTTDSMIDPPWGDFRASAGQAHPDWSVVAAPHPDSMGHMNGRKDIRFQKGVDWNEDVYGTASDGSDSLLYTTRHAATWSPVRMSCGMVACHGHDEGKDSDTSGFYVWTKGRRGR